MKAGIPTELHVYPGTFHGFEMHALAPLKKTFPPVVSSFLSVLGYVHTGFLAKAREKPA
jgi:acetyl esterase/lipase